MCSSHTCHRNSIQGLQAGVVLQMAIRQSLTRLSFAQAMVKQHKEGASYVVIPSVSHCHIQVLLDRLCRYICSLITCICSS